MKRFFLLVFFSNILCIFFTSCSKINLYSKTETPYHYKILKTVTDTITNHPDDALKLLKSINNLVIENDFTEQEYHEYQILLSEANYKNYYDQTNHYEVTIACNYFDSLASSYPQNIDISILSSKAFYYKAVGLEELKKEIPEVEDISSRIEDKNEDAFAVSRNALCPCGSGSKYKHCCGQIKD